MRSRFNLSIEAPTTEKEEPRVPEAVPTQLQAEACDDSSGAHQPSSTSVVGDAPSSKTSRRLRWTSSATSDAGGAEKLSEKSVFSDSPVSRNQSRRESTDMWLYSIPGFNLIYDVAGDSTPPTVDQLREIVTLFGLIGALMLSVVTSLASAIDYENLMECRARFAVNGTYYTEEEGSWQPANELLTLLSVSFWIFIFVTVATTLFLFALSAGADQLSNFRTRLKWWYSARWAFLFCFAMLLVGCPMSALAYNRFAMCALPDPYVEEDQAAVTSVEGLGSGGRSRASAWHSTLGLICVLLMALVILIMGIAHRSLSIYRAHGSQVSLAAISANAATPAPRARGQRKSWATAPVATTRRQRLSATLSRSRDMLRQSLGGAGTDPPSPELARTSDALGAFLQGVHGGDMPADIRRNVRRSLLQRMIQLDDLIACEDDDLNVSLLTETEVFDGLMGPTYRFWFVCALQKERKRRAGEDDDEVTLVR